MLQTTNQEILYEITLQGGDPLSFRILYNPIHYD